MIGIGCTDSFVVMKDGDGDVPEYAFLLERAPSKITLYRSWPFEALVPTIIETTSLVGQSTYEAVTNLRWLYVLKNHIEIVDFLGANTDLLSLLIECYMQVLNYFGACQLILELFADPEGTSAELFVVIPTSLGVKQARQCLKRFDEGWWLEASKRSAGRLNIDVEYV